jgi:hypothetical protein
MTPNRDISELFRQQIPKAQERPGSNVWRRLQRRLDTYDRWHKTALRISTQGVLFTLLLIAIAGPALVGISMEQQRRAELQNPPVILQVMLPQDTLPEVRHFLQQSSSYPGDTIFIQLEN